MNVYISIGNSDDKLNQAEWANYIASVGTLLAVRCSKIHGVWFSAPQTLWQNACWCVEFINVESETESRIDLRLIREKFRQDSIAWAEVPITEFI